MDRGILELLSAHKDAKAKEQAQAPNTIHNDHSDNADNYSYSDCNDEEEGEYETEEDDRTQDYGVVMTRTRRTHIIEEEDMYDSESDDEKETEYGEAFEAGESSSSRSGGSATHQAFSNVPDFSNVFQHTQPAHLAFAKLPSELLLQSTLRPIHFFSLFFTDEVFEELSRNTNTNATLRGAANSQQLHEGEEDDLGSDDGLDWQDTTAKELRVYLGILIYMGIFPQDYVEEFWNTSPYYPGHRFVSEMSLPRFQQIRRYFHVSDPGSSQDHWYSKLEPLSTKLELSYWRYYVPSTNVSINEMSLRFGEPSEGGPLLHRTVDLSWRMEGYKVMSLCDSEYTFSFLCTTSSNPYREIEQDPYLNSASTAVLQLVCKLPYRTRAHNIFMDDALANVPLFIKLRDYGIGACGRASVYSIGFPDELTVKKSDRRKRRLTVNGVVVKRLVLTSCWMSDHSSVNMLSTIHQIEPEINDQSRRGPQSSGRNNRSRSRSRSSAINSPSLHDHTVPTIVNDYNNVMGDIDASDLKRSFYDRDLFVAQTWMPLFLWLLDSTLLNAHVLSRVQGDNQPHSDFRREIAWDLIFGDKLVEPDGIDTVSHGDDAPFSDYTDGEAGPHIDDAAPHDEANVETRAYSDHEHGAYSDAAYEGGHGDNYSDRDGDSGGEGGSNGGDDGDSHRNGDSDGEEEADRAGDAEVMPAKKKTLYIVKSMTSLPATRMDRVLHLPMFLEGSSRPNCVLCRFKHTTLKLKGYRIRTPTTIYCSHCNVPLCLVAGKNPRNCFKDYHVLDHFDA